MMLDMRPVATGLPGPYAQLLPFILLPELWERAGAVRSLVDLLRAYLRLAGGVARQLDATQLSGILGIFQKLVATRQNDVHGFALLNAVMQYIDWVGRDWICVIWQFVLHESTG
jgi:exportin-2 (importin alpha re-exporter)